jgi:hypothetical protein
MATERQIQANRENAQKSTGPKTPDGKAKSSLNRLSHGFAANTLVMPGEDPEQLRCLLQDFITEYHPATATEQILVEKMATSHWLSLRAFRLQGESFVSHKLRCEPSLFPKDLPVLIRYQTTADRAFHKAHNELVKTQKQREHSQIGFEPQAFGEAVGTAPPQPVNPPHDPPKKAPIISISPTSPAGRPIPTFTDAEMDFPPCPEAIEFFKKGA